MIHPTAMKSPISLLLCTLVASVFSVIAVGSAAASEVSIDEDAFGKSLGGWTKKSRRAAEYSLSGSSYLTYRPESSPTPEAGIFVSVRIDHLRGWLSSNDHAMLEVTFGPDGVVTSAKSNIAIQGHSIASDVILGTSAAGQELTGAERAVQIGTDLVADLTAKLLRERIVEAGRVSFPAVLRHNYNLLYQSVRLNGAPIPPNTTVQSGSPADRAAQERKEQKEPAPPPAPAPKEDDPASAEAAPTADPDSPAPPPVAKPVPVHPGLDVKPYQTPAGGDLARP